MLSKQNKATFSLLALVTIAALVFWNYGPESDARHFAQKYDESKDQMDRCAMADLTGDAYGKASNGEKYDEWMRIRSKECAQAGVTTPQLLYQPASKLR